MPAIRTKSFITARNRNSILKLVKLQILWRNVVKYGKYIALRSLPIFIIFVLRTGKVGKAYHIGDESIFRILEDFATKICNFTNFGMLFLAVVKQQSFCSYCLDQNLVYQSLSWNCLLKPKYNHYKNCVCT